MSGYTLEAAPTLSERLFRNNENRGVRLLTDAPSLFKRSPIPTLTGCHPSLITRPLFQSNQARRLLFAVNGI